MKPVNPFVVFVFPVERADSSTRYGGFGKRLKKAGGFPNHDIVTVALENLAYITHENGEADVIDMASGVSLGDASFVYLKSWEVMPEEASALANFLFYKGVTFIDTLALGMGVSKLATTFRLWGQGVAMPNSVYVRRADRLADFLKSDRATMLGDKFIVKDIIGAKGKMNFLVDRTEAIKIVEENPDVHFVCQRFIPNDGDYRVGIYADEPGFIIKRVGSGQSHLNNTSAGGKATYIPVNEAPKKIIAIAKKASAATDLQVAGVDLIRDKETAKWYVLEVNQGSQIVTGAFVEENIKAFNENMATLLRDRHMRARKRPTRVIGRRAIAKMPELSIKKIVAKIDTGAYSSTLHAENIRVEKAADGEDELVFDVQKSEFLEMTEGHSKTVRIKDFFVQKVRSSNGHLQERYSFRTRMVLEKRIFSAVITLSDRSEMGYPLLIGRRMLRSRFIVNVELNEENFPEWSY